jgi:hypothetical protein
MQYSIEQIADAIHALNNSKPRSPTRDELVAVLAAHLGPANVEAPAGLSAESARPAPDAGVLKLRTEWDTLAAEVRAADAKLSALSHASAGRLTDLTDEVAAAENKAYEAEERLTMCAKRILKAEPVRSQPDLMLLGEACYWRLFPEPGGLMAPEAEAQISACQPDGIPPDVLLEAVLALLKGVRDVGRRRHG